MKTYVCKKLYMYSFLTNKGLEPYATQPDKYDCHKLIWLYENSAELRKAVEEYYSQPWFLEHAV